MATLSRTVRIRNPALFICDIQEKFRTKIYEFPNLAQSLYHQQISPSSEHPQLPNLHQYAITRKTRRNRLRAFPHLQGPNVKADVDKTLFSMITPELNSKLPTDPTAMDAIIVGIETHICVTQTTLQLLGRGYRVYIVVDGVSSVNPGERKIALERLRDAGAIVTSSESLLFEILGDANHEAFRAVSGLVKETVEETKGALDVFAKI
ncbi:hypothetical protein N7451_010780 [Penicillium sp. IBT 35674x]|nr:hypothetical protein N7451_010780 [Penicillium sp. IBT 35674x]